MIKLQVFDMDGTLVDHDCDVLWTRFPAASGWAPQSDLELSHKVSVSTPELAAAGRFTGREGGEYARGGGAAPRGGKASLADIGMGGTLKRTNVGDTAS